MTDGEFCDKCNKKPVANYQTGRIRWEIDEKGRYNYDSFDSDDNENEHLCEEHDI